MPFGDFSLIVDQSLLILQIMHYIDNTISDVLPQQMNYLLPILSTQSDQILWSNLLMIWLWAAEKEIIT